MVNPKSEIKLDALSNETYFSMDLRELSMVMEELGIVNRGWMNRCLGKTTVYVLVDKDGEIIEESDRSIVPSYDGVRKRALKEGRQIYMFIRSSNEYRDVTYFLDTDSVDAVGKIFDRASDDFFTYLDPVEGISTINAQSGLVNKLKSGYAFGKLYRKKPLLEPGNPKGGGHACGATVVDIDNAWESNHDQRVHIASQNIHLVHARGSKTGNEGFGSATTTRLERLHRFDDSILDIFDTYRFYSDGSRGDRFNLRLSLILYSLRKDFSPKLEEESLLDKYKTF